MSSSYSNFKKYVKFGDVPTKSVRGNEVPQNSFYKSVYYINSVIEPVKNVAFGSLRCHSLTYLTTYTLANIALQPLYI